MREEWSASGERYKPERLLAFEASWGYAENTCAADGMCQEKCPVKINTGELIKSLRHETLEGRGAGEAPPRGASVARWLAEHYGATMALVPPLLNVVRASRSALRRLSRAASPLGRPSPGPSSKPSPHPNPHHPDQVSLAHAVIGNTAMGGLAQGAWGIGNNYVPLWNKYMPRGAHALRPPSAPAGGEERKKVRYGLRG